jgi:hypothetical protein
LPKGIKENQEEPWDFWSLVRMNPGTQTYWVQCVTEETEKNFLLLITEVLWDK